MGQIVHYFQLDEQLLHFMEFNESWLKLVCFLKHSLLIYKVFIQSTKKEKTIHAIDCLFPITFPFLQHLLTCYNTKEKENLLIQYTF